MNVQVSNVFNLESFDAYSFALSSFYCLLNCEQSVGCNLNLNSCQMSNKLFKVLQKTDFFQAQRLQYYPGSKAKIENPL